MSARRWVPSAIVAVAVAIATPTPMWADPCGMVPPVYQGPGTYRKSKVKAHLRCGPHLIVFFWRGLLGLQLTCVVCWAVTLGDGWRETCCNQNTPWFGSRSWQIHHAAQAPIRDSRW